MSRPTADQATRPAPTTTRHRVEKYVGVASFPSYLSPTPNNIPLDMTDPRNRVGEACSKIPRDGRSDRVFVRLLVDPPLVRIVFVFQNSFIE